MYMCVKSIHFADVFTILLYYFGNVSTVRYFFLFFHFISFLVLC
jgi:hypothetical protein